MSKKLLTIMGIILAIVLGIIFTVRLLSPEDTWLCQNSSWVRHGNPADEMPTTSCK